MVAVQRDLPRPRKHAHPCAAFALIAATALIGSGDDPEGARGHLTVTQVFRPREPIAMEGSATELTVTQSGKAVARVRTGPSQPAEPEVLFDRPLDAGTYELEVEHHGCYGPTGGCFIPDEKAFVKCAGAIEIREGDTSELTVRVSSGFGAGTPSTCAIAES
jgi:hypothetical protein